MSKIKVRRKSKKNIYVHNDISNSASFQLTSIEQKEASGDVTGISLLIMSCLVMYAFSFEAKMNFIGQKCVKKWRERDPFHDKLKAICKTLGVQGNKNIRPYSTIEQLKNYRDSIAHGKPINVETDEIIELSEDEIDRANDLSSEWESHCTLEFARQCKADINEIWTEWLTRAGLEHYQTITSGQYSVTVIDNFIDKNITSRAIR